MDNWIVHKFGGSSVADADCFHRVADIIEASSNPREAVVLSACRGVTDALLGLVALAEKPDAYFPSAIEALKKRHVELARRLVSKEGLHEDTASNWIAIAATSPACCKPCGSSAPRPTRCAM